MNVSFSDIATVIQICSVTRWLNFKETVQFFSQHCCPERVVDTLKKGGICAVAPGGTYEALMSQNST